MEEIKESAEVQTPAPAKKVTRSKLTEIDETFLRKYKDFVFRDRGAYEQTGQHKIDIHVIVENQEHPEAAFSIYYDHTGPQDINKGIEKAKEWVNKLRRCRVCGCTEYNCSQCIAKTGKPCTWVEDDLCSACVEEPAPSIEVKDTRASQATTQAEAIPPVTGDSFFFQQLATLGNIDMTMRIMKVNGNFTISIIPGNKSKLHKPINVTGSPEDFDREFLSSIAPQAKELGGLVTNIDEVKKEKAESKENKAKQKPAKKPSSPKKSKPAAAKKTAPKKEKEKKPATEKKVKEPKPKKSAKKEAAEPATAKPAEPSLF